MNTSERILNGIKQALTEGKSKVNLAKEKAQIDVNETNQLTGSGLDKGGRTYFDDAFAALRYANPFRQGSRQIIYKGSAAQFVAKTGNVLNATGNNNPWGYTFTANDGEPDMSTSIWQLPTRNLSAQLPLRTAVLSDINNIDPAIVNDLMLEFSAAEAQAMAINDDQSGSTTYNTGAINGLRGLVVYNQNNTSAAFGSSGTAITNGIHTVLTVTGSPTYDNIVLMAHSLPPQYWSLPTTAWHMHPEVIQALRELKSDTGGVPMFIEVGDDEGGAVGYVFGFPVIPNPYLQPIGSGNLSAVLANWDQFYTIADNEEMSIKRFDQTKPGFITLYAEKRLASTIRNPFAGVFLVGA